MRRCRWRKGSCKLAPTGLSAVVLPGLDGGGSLLDDFASALGEHFDVHVVRYPPTEALGYDRLLNFVAPRLPAKPFILIGESFSGPLALRISASRPPHMLGVVLGASFARFGSPAARAALKSALAIVIPFAHVRFVKSVFAKAAIPRLLSPLLLGRWTTPERRRQLREALELASPRILIFRAHEALTADLAESGIRPAHPVLYLRAMADRLIRSSAAREVGALSANVKIMEIEAPHFLFQVAPVVCASAIRDFAADLERGR